MTIAYFVQSHRDPAQALRLLALLRAGSPRAILVSGHCPLAPSIDADALARLEVRSFRHRRPAHRARWSAIEPFLDAIERLRDTAFEWLVYLSAADYPLQPLARLEDRLRASPFAAFLESRAITEPVEGRRHQSVRRYCYRYHDLPRLLWLLRLLRILNGVQGVVHVQLTYGPRLGVRTPPPSGWQLRRGLVWSTLSRAAALHVADTVRAEPELVRYLRHTMCPEEALLQTVLGATDYRRCDDNLRFADYRGSRDGHPRTLTAADLPRLLASGKFFARKFDPQVDAAVLDRLDVMLAGAAGDQPAGSVPSRQ